MSMHFENTVFLGKQCIEKRSLTIGEWIMGRTNTRRKQSKSDHYCFASAVSSDRGSKIYLAS